MSKQNKTRKESLGLGIRALLEGIQLEQNSDTNAATIPANATAFIDIHQIEPNPLQPRTEFNPEHLAELANSIKIHGIIQPITVRQVTNNKYQIISGERRWRAAQIAELTQVPAYVRTALNDQEMLEMALIENIQRQDLNPIEIAISYQRLIEECALKHEELADRLAKNRSTVTNFLRLLKLPPDIQMALKKQQLTTGHARALIALEKIDLQLHAFKEVINKELSVRQTESLVRELLSKQKNIPKNAAANTNTSNNIKLPAHLQKIQYDLASHFGSKVQFKRNPAGKGELVIPFNSDDELNRILELIDY